MKSKPTIAASADKASSAMLVWGLSRRQAAVLAGILILTLAIYLPSLRNGWVFDDWEEFVDNQLIHSWSFVWNSLRYDVWWFRDPAHLPQSAYYRPLQNVWFAANALPFGRNPVGWHFAKIVLHLVAVLLCFRVAQLLTGDVATGLLTAAIFGVMPAHTGGVVWATAIPEPLSTTFELGAMLFLISRGPGWSRGLFIALILYACAMATHESAILFPLIVGAYAFLFEGGDESRAGVGTVQRMFSVLLVAAPFVAIAIAYMCARLNALGFDVFFGVHHTADSMTLRGLVASNFQYSTPQILMSLPEVLIAYLAVLALPGMAGPTHDVKWITHPQPLLYISATALVLLAAAAIVLARRSSNRRIYLFCAAWGFLTIAPALKLNALWYLVDDRYLYAPSFGWSLAFAVAAFDIAAAGSRTRKAVGTAMAVLLVAYALSTMQTERYWYSDLTFFQRCVDIAPHYSDYRIRLAAEMNKAGNSDGAARTLERGTTLDPDDAHMSLMLAKQYQRMGRELDFEREFEKFNELSAAMIKRHQAAEESDESPSPEVP